MDVGIRELRDNLSRYVVRLDQGTRFRVLSHSTPVARLLPWSDTSRNDTTNSQESGYDQAMSVGIRELRTNLSRYVARAKQGEEIVVTDHGKPVARLIPLGQETKVERLIRLGVAHPPKNPKFPRARPPRMQPLEPFSLSDIVIEQRGPY